MKVRSRAKDLRFFMSFVLSISLVLSGMTPITKATSSAQNESEMPTENRLYVRLDAPIATPDPELAQSDDPMATPDPELAHSDDPMAAPDPELAQSDDPMSAPDPEPLQSDVHLSSFSVNTLAVEEPTVTETVYFEDPQLELAIREKLKIPEGEITPENMLSITELIAEDDGITNLTGLEHAKNLVRLILTNNQIEDITVLQALPSLTRLSLYGNQEIEDISLLGSMTQLKRLDLGNVSGDRQVDFSFLSSLTDLEMLNLDQNQLTSMNFLENLALLEELGIEKNAIEDLSPLQDLTSLHSLYMADNQIESLSPLANLTQLHTLIAATNRIGNISVLENLTELEYLGLEDNDITSLLPLAGLTKLKELGVSANPLENPEEDMHQFREMSQLEGLYMFSTGLEEISFLTRFPQLKYMDVGLNKIQSIAGIEGLTQLESLYIDDNLITDLNALQNLVKLQVIQLGINQIHDVGPLAFMSELNYLDLSENQIADIAPLSHLNQLEVLGLYDNQIREIPSSINWPKLTHLDLGYNQVQGLEPLRTLTNLEGLYLDHNRVTRLEPLTNLSKLQFFWAGNNFIQDISVLSHMQDLNDLSLYDNQISDLSPLQSLEQLQYLYINRNQIRDLTALSDLTQLVELGLSENQIQDISPLLSLENLEVLELYANQITNLDELQQLTTTDLNYLSVYDNPAQVVEGLVAKLAGTRNDKVVLSGFVQSDGRNVMDLSLKVNDFELEYGVMEQSDYGLYVYRDGYMRDSMSYLFEVPDGQYSLVAKNQELTQTIQVDTQSPSDVNMVYMNETIYPIQKVPDIILKTSPPPSDDSSNADSSSSGGGYSPTPANQVGQTGGTIGDLGAFIVVPPSAVSKPIQIDIKKMDNPSSMPLAEKSKLASDVYEITKNITGNFDEPVSITLPFQTMGMDPLHYDWLLCWFDEINKVWVKVDDIQVDFDKGTVTGKANHFTKFAVVMVEKEKSIPLYDIQGHWAEAKIQYLLKKEIIQGYADHTFKPNQTITRAELVALVVQMLQLDGQGSKVYTDTHSHWAKDAIALAYDSGLVKGSNEFLFNPDQPITREQMMVIISQALKEEKQQAELPFTDGQDIAPWAKNAISVAYQTGRISGYPDGSMKPKHTATRAEAASLLFTLMEKQ